MLLLQENPCSASDFRVLDCLLRLFVGGGGGKLKYSNSNFGSDLTCNLTVDETLKMFGLNNLTGGTVDVEIRVITGYEARQRLKR